MGLFVKATYMNGVGFTENNAYTRTMITAKLPHAAHTHRGRDYEIDQKESNKRNAETSWSATLDSSVEFEPMYQQRLVHLTHISLAHFMGHRQTE